MGNDSLTPEQEERYEELYSQAVNTYLDKTDWNIFEWLDKDDQKEYQSYLDILYPENK